MFKGYRYMWGFSCATMILLNILKYIIKRDFKKEGELLLLWQPNDMVTYFIWANKKKSLFYNWVLMISWWCLITELNKDEQLLYMWCDQAKWVWTRLNENQVFNCIVCLIFRAIFGWKPHQIRLTVPEILPCLYCSKQ